MYIEYKIVGMGVVNKNNNKKFNVFLSVPVCWNTFHVNKMELLLDLLDLDDILHTPKSTLQCKNGPVLAHGLVPMA